jgi:hypothetical protein
MNNAASLGALSKTFRFTIYYNSGLTDNHALMASSAIQTYCHRKVPSENYRGAVAGPNMKMQIEVRHSHGSGVAGVWRLGELGV